MGVDTPRSLQNAAIFMIGKMFSLRGGVEHHFLTLTQLKRHHDPDYYTYYEIVSKTNSGSFKKIHVKGKTVPIYVCPDLGERCPEYILDKYLSKLPQKAFECDLFYLCPLTQVPINPCSFTLVCCSTCGKRNSSKQTQKRVKKQV